MSEIKWIKSQFQLHKKERKAIVILLVLIFSINILRYCYMSKSIYINNLSSEIQCFLESTKCNPKIDVQTKVNRRDKKKNSPLNSNKDNFKSPTTKNIAAITETSILKHKYDLYNKTPFNPNAANINILNQFDLSQYSKNNWLKYIDKGGKINNLQQLSKIYGITESEILEIKPYLIFPDYNTPKNQKKTTVKVDLNRADIIELKSIRGIGEVLSKRIVKFRSALGGFYNKAQLEEVYGLSDSLYKIIVNQVIISSEHHRFNLNTISFNQLASHPYITHKQAKLVLRYIVQNGPINSKSDFLKIKCLDDAQKEKLMPYITFTEN